MRFGVKLRYSIRAVVESASERGAIEMAGMNEWIIILVYNCTLTVGLTLSVWGTEMVGRRGK